MLELSSIKVRPLSQHQESHAQRPPRNHLDHLPSANRQRKVNMSEPGLLIFSPKLVLSIAVLTEVGATPSFQFLVSRTLALSLTLSFSHTNIQSLEEDRVPWPQLQQASRFQLLLTSSVCSKPPSSAPQINVKSRNRSLSLSLCPYVVCYQSSVRIN